MIHTSEHLCCVVKTINILVGNMKGRDYSEDIGIDERAIIRIYLVEIG
jgi:hypothetical protein